MDAKKTYLIDTEVYSLHYSIGRMETIENVMGCSIADLAGSLREHRLPTIGRVKTLFAYGMMTDGGVYAPIKKALEFADVELQENGYAAMLDAVLEQIAEDCDFLFR